MRPPTRSKPSGERPISEIQTGATAATRGDYPLPSPSPFGVPPAGRPWSGSAAEPSWRLGAPTSGEEPRCRRRRVTYGRASPCGRDRRVPRVPRPSASNPRRADRCGGFGAQHAPGLDGRACPSALATASCADWRRRRVDGSSRSTREAPPDGLRRSRRARERRRRLSSLTCTEQLPPSMRPSRCCRDRHGIGRCSLVAERCPPRIWPSRGGERLRRITLTWDSGTTQHSGHNRW